MALDREALARALRLYAVTDPALGPERILEAVSAAVAGGATMVQVREKARTTREYVALAERVVALCRPRGVPVIVNDRVDVALAAGADGVHVGPDDLPVAAARRILGRHRILGASAGTPEEARAAVAEGADYLGVGAVYATGTKRDAGAPIGLERLSAVVRAATVPVVAIGGIGPGRARPCLEAGAAGVAVVSALFRAADVAAAARALRRELDGAG